MTAHFTPPAPHTRLRVRSADGVQINVEIHGSEAAPTVVLVHGWACSTLFWAPVINNLISDFRVVVYDQRGHGTSDVPGAGHYSVQALVDDLDAVITAAVPSPQTTLLVGHSMGAMTIMAAGLCSHVMERTSAVVLTSTGFNNLTTGARIIPLSTQTRLRVALQRRILFSKLPLGPVTPLARAAVKYGTLNKAASKELAAVTAGIVHACPRKARAAWGHVLATLDVEAGVRALEVPTAVLVGSSDRLTPPHHARAIAEALPQCLGLTELPGVGHMTPLEVPDLVATLIRDAVPAPTSPSPGHPQ